MGLNCNSLIEKNNIMKIKILNGGFAQIPDNPLISRIVIKYCDLFRSDCDVFCKNKEVYHLKIMCSVFNSQYGLATSSDGKMLISGTWERGISAYNIQSGLLVWRYPKGNYYDNESGFYYLQSRYYDPEFGRFISADCTDYLGASGEILSINQFAYCENAPTTKKDSIIFKLVWYYGLYLKTNLLKYHNNWVAFIVL